MLRRWKPLWICLLLGALSAAYCIYDIYDQSGSQLPSAGARSQGQLSELLQNANSSNSSPRYHVQFSCGHDGLFSPEELRTAGLDFLVYGFQRTSVTLSGSKTEDTVFTGAVPVLCENCRCYWVCERNGCVAVYLGQDKATAVLYRFYEDMPVSQLPAEVQQQLREGISVQSEEELARVIEGLDG